MTIEEKVREIAAEFEGYEYVFEDWNTADKVLDKLPLPAIILILPVSGVISIGKYGHVRDAVNCALAFVDKVPKEADGQENGEVYNDMKQTARQFVAKINESGYFVPITGDISYNVIYEQLSCIVTGVVLQLQLKELVGGCE